MGKETTLLLKWLPVTNYTKLVKEYNDLLDLRIAVASTRPQLTKKLKELDIVTNKHLDYVKGYIADKFGKATPPSYYADFGIEKTGKTYILSRDRTERERALKTLVTAINKYGFNSNTYGKTFWTDISTTYKEQNCATGVFKKKNISAGVS